jgi:hypothetical protein
MIVMEIPSGHARQVEMQELNVAGPSSCPLPYPTLAGSPPAPIRRPLGRALGRALLALTAALGMGAAALSAQGGGAIVAAPDRDPRIHAIIDAASAARVEADIRTLANFGTRNTMSDTLSDTRGIGASRRWIKAEFDRISEACGGCLEV